MIVHVVTPAVIRNSQKFAVTVQLDQPVSGKPVSVAITFAYGDGTAATLNTVGAANSVTIGSGQLVGTLLIKPQPAGFGLDPHKRLEARASIVVASSRVKIDP
jgi:hypothetical protein